MNILLIGSGGREHALAWKLAQSPLLTRLMIAPGNPGTAACGENVVLDVADHRAVIRFCRVMAIDFVVIGPETPLVVGLVDDLAAAGVLALGPTRAAAQLEGSKAFTKALCVEAGIPTAASAQFEAPEPAKAYIRAQGLGAPGVPIVVKADGLAAGKGVIMAQSVAEADAAVDMMLSGDLGQAGARVVIEAFLEGEEVSLFALVDGQRAILFGAAQDHKRAFDGDLGPNTGGMGAYSPAPALTPALTAQAMREIVDPTVAAMAARGTPFRGVLFAGLMLTVSGPQLIEYNVRFGDPECQALMLRLDGDLLPLLLACARGDLSGIAVGLRDEAALTVVMAAAGYPGAPQRGSTIRGVEAASVREGVCVFHAGTAQDATGTLTAQGGRVLAVTARGPDLRTAQARAYAAVDAIDWPDGFCRRDIGWRALG